MRTSQIGATSTCLLGERHRIGIALAGQFDEIYILLFQAGGLQDPQHQRALRLTGAESDPFAAQVRERLDLDARRNAELIDRVRNRILAELRGNDLDLEPRPRRVDGRDVGDRSDVQRIGAKVSIVCGPPLILAHSLHLERQLIDQVREFQRPLRLRITDVKHRALRDFSRQLTRVRTAR